MQGIPAPRRQQHKQFQESPDHPLPSPGRLSPATHNPASNLNHQLRRPIGNAGSQNYNQAEAVTPVHAASGGYSARNPPGIDGHVGNERWQGQRNAPDGLDGDRRRMYSEWQEQPRAAAHPNDFAANGRQDPTSQPAQTAAPSRPCPYGGDDQETGNAGRPLDRFGNGAQALSGESAARKLAFERGGARWVDGGAAGEAESASDSVPRADFDELSSLCRDLLHEQKQLRQRLEEREERERLAAERSSQQEEARRQRQQQRGAPRRGGGRSLANQGTSSSSISSDGRGRVPTSVRESALRRDQRPKPKPGVAFGSSRPRMPGPTVDKPRVAANPKPVSEEPMQQGLGRAHEVLGMWWGQRVGCFCLAGLSGAWEECVVKPEVTCKTIRAVMCSEILAPVPVVLNLTYHAALTIPLLSFVASSRWGRFDSSPLC